MKKTILLFSILMCAIVLSIQAQAPQGIPYQAVARNSSGNLIAGQNISLRFSIHDVTANGTVVYSETQSAATNALGLFSVTIGQGTPVTGTFSAINWGTGAKFTQVELDPAGGNSYTDMGTNQMMSVPYALFAGNGGGTTYTSGTGISLSGNVISNTAPDQTVTLTGTGATSVSGSYPNFTINSTGGGSAYTGGTGINVTGSVITNTAPDQTVSLTGAGATTVTGSYPNFTISSTAGAETDPKVGTLSNNKVPKWNGATLDDGLIYDDGTNVGIGTTNPLRKLEVNNAMRFTSSSADPNDGVMGTATFQPGLNIVGINTDGEGRKITCFGRLFNDDGIIATGTIGSGATLTTSGAGTRMMWYPKKGVFRAGSVTGTSWDLINLGDNSFAAGLNTNASGPSSVAMGNATTASGNYAVSMGISSTASGNYSVAMGSSTTASGDYSVAMGLSTTASGDPSVAMGYGSIASGFASVAMGFTATADANYTVALGNSVSTNGKQGSCIIGDGSTFTVMNATVNNQFSARFEGGYRLFSNTSLTTGVTLAAGAGSWTSISDKNKKENFNAINTEEILQKVGALPLSNWNYKSQAATVRHIGPMAQDFFAAFHLDGESDTTINTLDIDGINMAAIQALKIRTDELRAAMQQLEKYADETSQLKADISEMKKQMDAIIQKQNQQENTSATTAKK